MSQPGHHDTEDSPRTLDERIQRLEDLEAARGLLHRYALAVDTIGPEGASALWTDDGVLQTRLGDFTGPEEIAEFFRERSEADPSVKRHFICEPLLTWIEVGRVLNTSYFMFTGQGTDSTTLGWGTYDDTIVITHGQARFARRHIRVVASGDPTTGWALPSNE